MTSPKPDALEVLPRHIPQALKSSSGWLLWRYELRGGKWTKPPLNSEGVSIDAHDPKNWTDFSTALQAYQRGDFDGIGFDLNAMDSLAGADLDHCIKDGIIEPWAAKIVEELGGYAEISPSGEGVRVLGYGKLRREGRKKGNIEMYDRCRYLTVTGHKLDGGAVDLVDFDEALNRVHSRIWPDSPEGSDSTVRGREIGEDLAERFQAFLDDDPIFRGRFNTPASVGCRSDHEFHLCARLWETGFNEAEIRSLMDSSPQEKWQSRDDKYKGDTIQNAIRSARASERGRAGAGSSTTTEEAVKYLDGIAGDLKKDPTGLNDSEVIGALRVVYVGNRLFFDTFLKKINPGRDAIKTIKAMIEPPEEEQKETVEEQKIPEVSDEIKRKAANLLRSGGLIDSIIKATNRQMKGGEDLRRLSVASGASTYMDGPKLHSSAVGEPQTGKTAHTDAVMVHFPEEDVIPLSEVSPQAFYYMSKKMDFDKKIVRIDDAREAQIPVIKVLEDDSPIPAKKYTVIEGEGVELGIRGRPVLWTTSVGPLVDRSGQTVSRSLMVSPDGVTDEEATEIKRKIWETEQFGTARATEDDEARQIHRTAFRMLRGPGAGVVLIPFTVDPPTNCGNRGTRQFATLIKSLAFINQFQRVRFYGDGKRYILANFDDLREAARLWFEFFDLQTHKSGGKWVRDILVCLETSPPEVELGRQDTKCRTPKEISELSGLNVRTVNDYLMDLFKAGIVDREHIRAPGNPFAYWISAKYALLKESIDSGNDADLGELGEIGPLPKYLQENQVQEPSISIIFNELGKDIEEWVVERNNGFNLVVEKSSCEKITSLYLESFRLNATDEPNEAEDSDLSGGNSGKDDLPNPPKSPEEAPDSDDLGNVDKLDSLPKSGLKRDPPEPKDEDRIFGLTPSYYLDLGGGKLPTVRALMDDQGWDATKADLALGMLRAAGVVL